jgi:hypothetical protein
VRDQILSEIRRLAALNDGKPPGFRRFETETGIRESAWRGVYWARWSDAVQEAGFQPNAPIAKHSDDFLLQKYAELCRHFGKLPSSAQFRMCARSHEDFPGHNSIRRNFQSTTNMIQRLAKWTNSNSDYRDVAVMLVDLTPTEMPQGRTLPEGFVYLMRSGAHYKIGRSEELERRVKQIRVSLPEAASLVHSIRTDDPAGIEASWHKRFADRRANGEWFKLSNADVAAFKRRKYQ